MPSAPLVKTRPQIAFIQVGENVGTVEVWNGGAGGIRTLPAPLKSVSYRNHVAAIAMNAVVAVAHCPPLPADAPLDQVRSTLRDLERSKRPIPYEARRHGARDNAPLRHSKRT